MDEFAWACGFFEGEGSILYTPFDRPKQTRRGLEISQKEREPLDRFQAAVGVGRIYGPYPNGMHMWKLSRWDELEPLLRRMLPGLCTRRRERAELLLANPPSVQGRRGITHCKRGHDLTDPANVWIAPGDGRRYCVPCRKERAAGR